MQALLLALGLTVSLTTWAQTSWPEQALRAADSANTFPLPAYQPLPATGAGALVRDAQDWRSANATVAEFPRGHQDLIRWERAHGLADRRQPTAAPTMQTRPEHAR